MRLACWFIVVLLCSSFVVAADDQYKPWLHKATVPEHPKIKLFGQYATNVFPGAGTYSFPIDVPKGTNSLQPSLSLRYNSQNVKSRPGTVGAGWSLTQSYIYRDVNSTPDNTTDDEFILVLDDTPYELIYNSADGLFHTEVEYHFKIQNVTGGSNTYSRYWVVTLKNGVEYRFGYTSDAELGSNTGRSYAVRWNLNLVTDPFDNVINYSYREDPNPEDNGTAYLDEINYNRDQQRTVKFGYEHFVRPDRRRVFEQGNRLDESRRLNHISLFAENKLVRRYQLNYTMLNPALSTISSIKDFGADNSSLWYNVTFSYYSSEAGYTNGTTWTPPALFSDSTHEDFGVRLLDVNNDGFMDIIRSRGATSQKNVWINNKLNNWTLDNSRVLPNYIVTGAGVDEGVRFADVDENGFADWIYAKNGVRNVSLHNGTAWVFNSSWTFPVDIVDGSGVDQGVLLEDIDGDGRVDIITSKAGATKEVYVNTGAGWRNRTSVWNFPVDAVTSTGADRGVRLADVNGDGFPDILLAGQDGGNYRNAWLNNGSGWVNSTVWIPPFNFTTLSNTDNGVRFADVNGDGALDLIEDFVNSSSTSRGAWINNGSGWIANDTWQAPEAFTSSGFNVGRRLADVNGDGFVDLVVSHQDSSQQYTWRKNIVIPYLLLTIRNEYGGNTTLNYTSSTRYNNTDEDGLSDMGFGVYVVTNTSTGNGLSGAFGVTSLTTYNYSYGKYNYPNSEFRGFGITVEGRPAAMVTHYFYQDDPRRGKEYRQVIADRSGLNFSKSEQDFNYTFTNGIYNVSLRSAASYLYDGVGTPKVTNISYVYDVYDNPLLIHELGEVNATGDERTWNYSYAIDTSDWFLDRRARETLLDENNNTVKETKYYYDDQGFEGILDKGALTKVERWHNLGNHSFSYFEYDQWGNVIRQTDSLGKSMSFGFDATHTYPSSSVNALGHVTLYNYNLGTGNLMYSEKNGIRTSYEYDTFGRVSREIQPLDTASLPTKSYNYSFDGIAPERETISLKTTANKSEKISYYYDGFAQLVQLKNTIENDQQIAKNIFYDDSGRVKAEQNPYFTTYDSAISSISGTDAYTNYTYDAVDRVIQVRNTDGTFKNITFNQWNITDYDENGHKHQYLLDSRGQITAVLEFVQDPILGTNETFYTGYEYDDNGNLIQITDNEGNVFEFTYDSLSRKTVMNDPDMGVWRYYYDENGNLVKQTGGGGNLITGDGYYREYDGNGQLIRVRNGSTSTSPVLENYTYDHSGQRIKVWRNDSANTTIYTPFPEMMRIVNSSGTYDYYYIYHEGQLVARKNPDGTTQYEHTDHLGSVSSITNGTGGILENSYYNPYGEILSGGTKEDKLYTGQFADELTNQYYYGARYYVPSRGQFAQPDTLLSSVYDPQQLNRYAYARNNPYAFADDSGQRITYKVENYGGGDQISIYQDQAYIGRVTSETVTTTEFGSGYSATTYDYTVRRGYQVMGSNDKVEVRDAPTSAQKLSSITNKDKERLLRDENLEYINAITSDTLDIVTLGGGSKVPTILTTTSRVNTGVSFLTAKGVWNKIISLIPVSATAQKYFSPDSGYKVGQKIPAYKGPSQKVTSSPKPQNKRSSAANPSISKKGGSGR